MKYKQTKLINKIKKNYSSTRGHTAHSMCLFLWKFFWHRNLVSRYFFCCGSFAFIFIMLGPIQMEIISKGFRVTIEMTNLCEPVRNRRITQTSSPYRSGVKTQVNITPWPPKQRRARWVPIGFLKLLLYILKDLAFSKIIFLNTIIHVHVSYVNLMYEREREEGLGNNPATDNGALFVGERVKNRYIET